MKQNPHKFPELLEKQNEETQPSENQMNLPYLLKKRKDPEPLPNKEVIKQQKIKDEEEKNKKTTKSIKSNQNIEPLKSPPNQNPTKDPIKTIINPNMAMSMSMSNSQPNLNNMPSYLTINNTKNMINEPAIFKNYSNPLFNNSITPLNPTPIAPMNTFLANTSNMIIQPNLSLAANPINSLGNYVQIPVMIANRPPAGNWSVLDNLGTINDQMALNNLAPTMPIPNDTSFLQGSASNMQKIFDNNIFIQQGNNNNNNPMNNPNNQNINNNNNQGNNTFMNSYLNSFQEFETRMFNIIKNQNRTLQLIKDDNEKTHDTLNKIKLELNLLKESLKVITDPSGNPASNVSNRPNPNEIKEEITSDFLIKYIYNQNPINFKYELVIKSNFPKIIYKERYFNFDVILVDINTKEKIRNSNRIPLDLAIYTSENPPKMIKNNTLGNRMINWNPDKYLNDGEMSFEKVQIRDVSSHYRNGSLFLIVFAKAAQNNTYQKEEDCEKSLINYQDVKPLIIEKMVIRAKKLKLKKKKIKTKNEDRSDESL